MTDAIRFRLVEEPVGVNRIAWSYLAVVVGLLGGGLLWALWAPFGGSVCGPEDVACQLGWTLSGALLGPALALVLAAWAFRLGWEWWAVLAALILSAPVWFDAAPDWVAVVAGLLAPALAAAATWTGPQRPAWRPWMIGVLLALAVVATALVLLL